MCAAVLDSPDPEGSAGPECHKRPYSDNCPTRPRRESSPRNLPPPSPGSRSPDDESERKIQIYLLLTCDLLCSGSWVSHCGAVSAPPPLELVRNSGVGVAEHPKVEESHSLSHGG